MKIKHFSFLILFIFSFSAIQAQALKRKGLLGIRMQNLTDSIISSHQIPVKTGVFITTVVPNSTFSNLGIQQNDVLTHLNETPVQSIQDVLNITQNLFEGDIIKAAYISKTKTIEESTTLLGRPIESFENANVSYGEVHYKDNTLRSILVTPKTGDKAPVIYFLQGYTCSTVETFRDWNPVRRLIQDWVNAGYAVYRIEKPGVGDSKSAKHCSVISFDEELQAFKEGYKDLLKKEVIDTDNVFMFGHSMGGVIAPLLNELKTSRGIMVYGTVGENWYDYMVDLYTIQPKHFGTSDAQIKEDNKVNLKFNDDFLLKKMQGEELVKNQDYATFFNEADLKRNQYIGRHFKFWQNLADIDIPKAWSKVKTNVLAMYGEFDIQAINPEGTKVIAQIVNDNGGKGTYKLIPGADHGFVNFDSMQHNVETLGNGTYGQHAQHNFSSTLSEETIEWLTLKLNS